ncbi:MAG: hypothetical protein QXJ97_07070 [Desulfurococcaceae archaeon]
MFTMVLEVSYQMMLAGVRLLSDGRSDNLESATGASGLEGRSIAEEPCRDAGLRRQVC